MQQRPTTMESFMQSFWAVLGACSGVLIGISKEGVDLLSSLRSIQGWKQIYTGTSPTQTKKIDNGNRPSAYSQAPPKSGIVFDAPHSQHADHCCKALCRYVHTLFDQDCEHSYNLQDKTRSSNFWVQGLLSSKPLDLQQELTQTPRSWVGSQLHQCLHQSQ